jgi:Na+-transporting NADH:ubiquinone oxidoreductase subunit NqrE
VINDQCMWLGINCTFAVFEASCHYHKIYQDPPYYFLCSCFLYTLITFKSMGANPKYESHFVDLYLPPATIVPVEILILGYTLLLLLDYVLIKNDEKIARVISPKLLRFIIATYHFLVPIFFASKYDFGNISFMIHPWTTAAQIVFLTKSDMSFGDWIPFVIKVATFQDDSPTTDTPREIRLKGLQKVARGIAKFAFMKVALDGILPEDLSDLLALPFYSPKAMFITYVLALRIYCMLSTVDIIMGFTQAVFLIRFNDLFDNPFLATRSVTLCQC